MPRRTLQDLVRRAVQLLYYAVPAVTGYELSPSLSGVALETRSSGAFEIPFKTSVSYRRLPSQAKC